MEIGRCEAKEAWPGIVVEERKAEGHGAGRHGVLFRQDLRTRWVTEWMEVHEVHMPLSYQREAQERQAE